MLDEMPPWFLWPHCMSVLCGWPSMPHNFKGNRITGLNIGKTQAIAAFFKRPKLRHRPYALTSRLHNNDAMLGVKACRAARTCFAGRAHWRSPSQSVCAPGPARRCGMQGFALWIHAWRWCTWRASFDPQHHGGALLWRHMHMVYSRSKQSDQVPYMVKYWRTICTPIHQHMKSHYFFQIYYIQAFFVNVDVKRLINLASKSYFYMQGNFEDFAHLYLLSSDFYQ